MDNLRIDIVSDISCPFCAIGYLQLNAALEELGQKADIHWHPYDINPAVGNDGLDLRANLNRKYGHDEAACDNMFANITSMGAPFGFEFNYPKGKKVYSSLKGHQLIKWAENSGKQTELKFALLQAFFRDGLDYANTDILVGIVRDLGLDETSAREALDKGTFAKDVNDEIAYWQSQGVSGVPTMIFNQKFATSGAQGVENFKRAIGEAG